MTIGYWASHTGLYKQALISQLFHSSIIHIFINIFYYYIFTYYLVYLLHRVPNFLVFPLDRPFQLGYRAPKMKIICKSYDPEKFLY
jgi:hypothetical protein